MRKLLVFIFLSFSIILSMNLILAESIEETIINVKIENGTLTLENTEYSGNTQSLNLNVTNGTIKAVNFSFPIFFIKNESIDSSVLDKYIVCISEREACNSEKSQFNHGWNLCLRDLADCEEKNNESVKEELNKCVLDKQRIDIELSSKNSKITDLEEEEKGKSNSLIMFVVGAFIVGVVGKTFWDRGGIGSQAKDKSGSELNPQRAS